MSGRHGLHLAPVLLGDGVRLFDNPGGAPIRLWQPEAADPDTAVNVRHRVATGWSRLRDVAGFPV